MIRSTMSIMGLYNFDPRLFEGFRVPEGMNRDNVITEILAQCAELELVYPSFNTMKLLIKTWTDAEFHIWTRALHDATIEYNPIWNVDGIETEVTERDLHDVGKSTNSGKITDTTNTSVDTETTSLHEVAGYNSEGLATGSQDTVRTTAQPAKNETKTVRQPEDINDRTLDQTGTLTITKTRQGNIGVTKTQDMLRDDWELLPLLNAYQFIVDSFKRRFCLLVY